MSPVAELLGPPVAYVNPTFSPMSVLGVAAMRRLWRSGYGDSIEVASGTSRFVLDGFFTTIAIDALAFCGGAWIRGGIYDLVNGEEVVSWWRHA